MQIARASQGGKALSVMTVDSPVDARVLDELRVAIDADELREIDVTLDA